MRTSSKFLSLLLALFAFTAVSAAPAMAKCTRLAFSVNDYGKVGPTSEAKRLLDVYIAKWTGERGITNYRTGKKSVKCELFLDFIVFDEYTCRAEATVCWAGSTPEGGVPKSSSNSPAESQPAPTTTGSTNSASGSSNGRYVSGN